MSSSDLSATWQFEPRLSSQNLLLPWPPCLCGSYIYEATPSYNSFTPINKGTKGLLLLEIVNSVWYALYSQLGIRKLAYLTQLTSN